MRIELLGEYSAGMIIGLIAAREAGASGASEEEYLEVLPQASARLPTYPLRHDAPALFRTVRAGEARDALAAASAFQLDAGTQPICSRVQWKICTSATHFPDGILDWLEEQPYIEVQRL